jgi:hypothetical protein
MPLDTNYPVKKDIGDDVRKGASEYLDATEKLRLKREKAKIAYDKKEAERRKAMNYLRKLGGKK